MGHTAWCAVGAQGFTMHYVTNMRLQKKERRSGSSSTWTP